MKHEHVGVTSIDYYASISGMRSWNAGFKMLFAICTLLFCIIAGNLYISVAVILSMGILTVGKGKLPLHDYLHFLKIPLAFVLMGTLAISMGIATKPAGDFSVSLHWVTIYFTKEGFKQALLVAAKAFGALSAMYMLCLSTTTGEIITVLRFVHLPKLIVELMHMIYRFIFIMLDAQSRMKSAAISRLGYVDFKTSCRTFGSIAGNLLVVSLKRANAYYDAMLARCYDGDMRFWQEKKPLKPKQIVGAMLYFIFLILLYFELNLR